MADPDFASVVFLCNFDDGTDGATTATDLSNSGHTLTFNGSAEIDTAQSPFGGSSLLIGGFANAYVQAPDSADWHLSSANSDEFTVEAWVRTVSVSPQSFQVVVGQWNTSSNRSWAVFVEINGSARFYWSTDSDDFPNIETAEGVIDPDTWHHIAVDKDSSGKIRLYVDGVMLVSDTPANSAFADVAVPLRIGQDNNSNRAFNGWIGPVRITKGVARYATDTSFTVPTAPFETGGGGTDATATPSGVSGTGSVGSPQVNLDATVSLTGVAGAGSVGSVSVSTGANDNATPEGLEATGSVGSVTVTLDSTATVEGVSGTGGVGSVTVSIVTDATITLTGVSATGVVGTVVVADLATVAAVSGLEAVGSIGSVTIKGWLSPPPASNDWTGEGAADDVWAPVAAASGDWS